MQHRSLFNRSQRSILWTFGLACIALASAQPETGNPPTGPQNLADDRQYDPNYEPRMDPNHPSFDPNYDANDDPHHPLKSEIDPGDAWNLNRRTDGSPFIRQAKADWNWGELYYGLSYPTQLVVTNNCDVAATISITVENLPYLKIPNQVTVPAQSKVLVQATIQTPPKPKTPFIPAGQMPPPEGIFLDITDGKVTLWHPWNPPCDPKRVVYHVSGHIHFPEEQSDKDQGPTTLATTDPCTVYWNTGEPPVQLRTDCTERFRALALHYRERVLQLYVEQDPELWDWLPSASEIRSLSADELITVKEEIDTFIEVLFQ